MKYILIVFTLSILKSGVFNIALPESTFTIADHNQDFLSIVRDTAKEDILSIQPFHLEIVSPSSGVQFYRNGIVFLAYSKGAEKMSQKHLSFGSLRPFMALVADTLPGEYMPFLPSSSKIFPTEAITFSRDFNTMYLSLVPEKDTKEKIFKAAYTQNGWVIDDRPLSFCNVDYLFTHPALSNNGDFLIFSSNLKGSSGGLDLYISRKKDEMWSVPENLGEQINTTGNELFAALDAENNLYFSSDKLPGQGGYDVFVSIYDGHSWGIPHNLSEKINSQNDEVAFTLNRDNGKSAFYTSRERSGKGEMKLYRIAYNPHFTPTSTYDLSKQIFALAGIKEQEQLAKTEISEAVALNTPEKVQPAVEITKADAPVSVPEAKKTPEVFKEAKPQPVIAPAPEEKRDVLIYRIQYAANTRPVGSQKVTIAGKSHYSYEYLYKGGYRSAVGELSTLAEATRFLNLCRQSGYNQAFLVAFKNNERITDAEAKLLEAQLSKTATKEIETPSKPPVEPKQAETKANPGATALNSGKTEGIIFRVQILTSTKPVGSYTLTVAGQNYKTFEYLYLGGYRTTIGEFNTFKEATGFLKVCKQAGYNQAFIVVFKDNVRTNDPSLLK